MILLAFVLPADLRDMPWVAPLVQATRDWAPAVSLFAGRAAQPGLFEAHMSIALALALVGVLLGLCMIRPGYSEVPFYSWAHKLVMIAAELVMAVLIAAYFFLPAMAQGRVGLLEGRAGVFTQLVLSGRFGLALFPFFSSTALLFFTLLLWIAIREPVRTIADLVLFPEPKE